VRRHGVLSLAALSVLAAGGCSPDSNPFADTECVRPAFVSQSVAERSTNVLSALASARTHGADSVVARFGSAAPFSLSSAFSIPAEDSVRIPILGLEAGTRYEVQLTAVNRCGSTAGAIMSFTTGSLPADLPAYEAAGPAPDSGYIAFAAGSYGIVIDNTGRVVWYHRFTNGPGLNFQAQPDGRYAARPNTEPGKQGTWIEIDPLGDTTRKLTCADGLQPRMHDMIGAADGSYWLMCDETRTVDLSAQGRGAAERITGTSVQHLSASGEVLFSWSPFDHIGIDLTVLDAEELSASPINWTHGNAIDLSEDGNVIVSFRNLSELLKIDTQTGQVLWRLGGRNSSFTLENSSAPPFRRQHGVRAVGSDILLLDNLGETGTSRAERYRLNPSTHSARLSASFSAPPGVIAKLGGSAQSLGNHTLVAFGNGGGLDEYDAAGNMVWHVVGNAGYVFRAQRIRSLYHPGAGDPR
jgi:outer membrane protein assembly factor BamB